MIKKILILFIIIIIIILFLDFKENKTIFLEKEEKMNNIKDVDNKKFFYDSFEKDDILGGAGSIFESENKYWWLNSGGYLFFQDGVAKTIFGELEENDEWRLKYQKYNPVSTDNGYRPQNIFRLITKSKWKNFEQEIFFKIKKYNLSNSKHRNQSNGVLLFNRYIDGDNLYYVGLRVDGKVVVKKKKNGKYFLLGIKKVLDGKYDKNKNPNLIKNDSWIGLKSRVFNINNDKVKIEVYLNFNGQWKKEMTVIDDGFRYGGDIFNEAGHAGIRSDFMDIEFDNYKIKEI